MAVTSCCSIFTVLIIFPVTNTDALIQAQSKTGSLIRPHTFPENLIFPSKGSYCTFSYPFFSPAFFFLFLSHPLKSPHPQMLPYMVQLFCNPLNLHPLSPFLFSPFQTSIITLINCFSFRPILSLSLPLCYPSAMSLYSSSTSSSPSCLLLHLFLCCYCLHHALSFSFSLICSERVIYTATTHAEWRGAEQSSESSLTCQNGHHLRNTTKNSSSTCSTLSTNTSFYGFAIY